MFIIIVFDRVSTYSSPVSSLDLYCSLLRDQSWDVTPRWEFLLIKTVLNFTFLHLSGYYYYDCSNRCAEALVAFRNSLLNHLNIVHGGKILTIIIIIHIFVNPTPDDD